jgi:hypothetical protein
MNIDYINSAGVLFDVNTAARLYVKGFIYNANSVCISAINPNGTLLEVVWDVRTSISVAAACAVLIIGNGYNVEFRNAALKSQLNTIGGHAISILNGILLPFSPYSIKLYNCSLVRGNAGAFSINVPVAGYNVIAYGDSYANGAVNNTGLVGGGIVVNAAFT